MLKDTHIRPRRKATHAKVEQEGTRVYKNHATQGYSFGEITFAVSVEGNVDRPNAVVDHMLATATAVAGIEAIQLGISDSQSTEGKLEQKCVASVEFGEIKVTAEISFDLKKHVSMRTLNNLVFNGVLPKIWQTAGIYFGDHQSLTTPQAPLSRVPHKSVLDSIDDVLGINIHPALFESEEVASGSRQQRQLATR